MSSSLNILCPNKKRAVVKVNPGQTLRQVMDEALKKQGFSSDNFGLKHHGKFVDLSLSYRLSGLPNNATLEAEERGDIGPAGNTKVQIALQLASGERKTGDFDVDISLLDVLTAFDDGLTRPEGENAQPVVLYLTQQYVGALVLATTTLRSLGVGNRALLRYNAQSIEEQRMREINAQVEKAQEQQRRLEVVFEKKQAENAERARLEEERRTMWEEIRRQEQEASSIPPSESAPTAVSMETDEPASASASHAQALDRRTNESGAASRMQLLQHLLATVDNSLATNSDLPFELEVTEGRIPLRQQQKQEQDFSDFRFPEATKGQNLMERREGRETVGEERARPACERQLLVYRMDDAPSLAAASVAEPPSDFFDITFQDVQRMQQLLKEEMNAMTNRAFLPEATVRQRDLERKRRAWKHTVVRILLPQRWALQAVFYSAETVQALHAFVSSCLKTETTKFTLCIPPNVGLDKASQSLLEAGVSPSATLVFKRDAKDDDGLVLKEQLSASVSTLAEAEVLAHQILSANDTYQPYRPTTIDVAEPKALKRPVDYEGASSNAGASASAHDNMPKWFRSKRKHSTLCTVSMNAFGAFVSAGKK